MLNKRLNYEKYPVCGVPCPPEPEDIDCAKCKNFKYSKFKKAFSIVPKEGDTVE